MKRKNTKPIKKSNKHNNSLFSGPKLTRLLAVLLIALVGAALLVKGFASDGQLYLSPATATVLKGSNMSVDVRINPSTPVDIVEDVTVIYDATKLQFVSIDTTGSAFESSLTESITTGQIKLSRATFGASISVDSLIAKIHFKALAGNKTTTVGVNGNAASQSTGEYTFPAGGEAKIQFSQLKGNRK